MRVPTVGAEIEFFMPNGFPLMTEIRVDALSTARSGDGEGLPAWAGAGAGTMALTRSPGSGDTQRPARAFPVLADLDRSRRLVDQDQHKRFTKAVAEEGRWRERNPPVGSTEPDDANGIVRQLVLHPRVDNNTC